MTRYQKEFLKLLKGSYDELKKEIPWLISELNVSFEDVAAATYTESSFGADEKLCSGYANPFQMYKGAYIDALDAASRLGIDTTDIQRSIRGYSEVSCRNGVVDMEIHRKHLKGALKAFLLYIWKIIKHYKPPRLPIGDFERAMLVYFLGPKCARALERKPKIKWDEVASSCLGIEVSPSLYVKRLEEGRKLALAFFRE